MSKSQIVGRCPLPNGYVGLQYGATKLAIYENRLRRHRILFWRKRWVNVILAETPHAARVGQVVELAQNERCYTVTVDGKTELQWMRMARKNA